MGVGMMTPPPTTTTTTSPPPLEALEDLRVYNAVSNLHNQLSEWAHTADPPEFIVRRLLADRNDITIDVVGLRTSWIDRFVVTLNAKELTAMAGTLGVERKSRAWPCASFAMGNLQRWMRATIEENLQLVLVGEV